MITGRPRWPKGTLSPWTGDPQPPPVRQVALAYPGRALGNAFVALLFGGFISGFLVFGTAWLVHSFLGVGMLASPKPIYIVWPFVSIPLWYGAMYAEIRGWMISDDRD